MADLETLEEDQILEGYLSAERGDPEPGPNRGRSFWHGWRSKMMELGSLEIDEATRSLIREMEIASGAKMKELIFRAREFARHAHSAQPRKYTGEPYFVHLEEVATTVENAGIGDIAIAAAWLHDVIEDQGVTPERLVREFGPVVTALVVELTDTPPNVGMNRERRKALDRDRLSKASATSQSIKCADLISNTSSIVQHDPGFAKLYLEEKRATLEVLTRADAGLLESAWKTLLEAERKLLEDGLAKLEDR